MTRSAPIIDASSAAPAGDEESVSRHGLDHDCVISRRAGNTPGRHPVLLYGGAIASVGLSWAITRLLSALLGNHRSLLFFTAVVVSSLYGGFGPGLLATVCATAALCFISSDGRVEVSQFAALRAGTFLAIAIMVSWMSGAKRRAEMDLRNTQEDLEQRVQERTAALSVAVQKLEREIEDRRAAERDRLDYQGRLRNLAAQLLSTEEAERRRLAVLLHDGIGQVLAVAQIKLESLPGQGGDNSGALADIRELVAQAISQTRVLTTDLSPPILYEAGLTAALEWLAAQTRRRHDLAINVRIDEGTGAVDEQTRALVFAAVRELIMNVVKHAHASRASISLSRTQNVLRISVGDNGIGLGPTKLDARAMGGGFGLFNIKERLGHLGGTLWLESEPGKGTMALLEVPLSSGANGRDPSTVPVTSSPPEALPRLG